MIHPSIEQQAVCECSPLYAILAHEETVRALSNSQQTLSRAGIEWGHHSDAIPGQLRPMASLRRQCLAAIELLRVAPGVLWLGCRFVNRPLRQCHPLGNRREDHADSRADTDGADDLRWSETTVCHNEIAANP